jgi:perosamine synthetase
VSRIPITKPIVTKEMLDASNDALRNERLVMGESVFKFEEEFARYIGVDHAVSVSSGTDALILAMIALDVKKKNVLTTPFSFVATGTSIVHAGGIPDFVDVSAIDYNIDPQGLGGKLDNGTGAVLPVHLFGDRKSVV